MYSYVVPEGLYLNLCPFLLSFNLCNDIFNVKFIRYNIYWIIYRIIYEVSIVRSIWRISVRIYSGNNFMFHFHSMRFCSVIFGALSMSYLS